MPSTPALDEAKRQWLEGALAQVQPLIAAAALLRHAFDQAPPTSVGQNDMQSAKVLAATTSLLRWLAAPRAPRGLRKAEAELGATAGVYRNAAVAFSSLADAEPHQHAARCAACVKLLDQGDHHADLFLAIVDKKRAAL
jgi:hypothetical protein